MGKFHSHGPRFTTARKSLLLPLKSSLFFGSNTLNVTKNCKNNYEELLSI